MPQYQKALVWFRRDLRDYDHAALYYALEQSEAVYCVFVFDTEILDALPNKQDRRVEFIWESVRELQSALQAKGGDLIVRYGRATSVILEIANQLGIEAVYANHDYEPSAIARDAEVAASLQTQLMAFHSFKDQVIFEKDEIVSQSGKPYSVYTPYKNAYLKKLDDRYLQPYPVERYAHHLAKMTPVPLPSLEDIGFARTNLAELKLPTGMHGAQQLFADFTQRIAHYAESRNFPAAKGVSYLSTHLRFGTISIRQLAAHAANQFNQGAQTWLHELIWRDFYFQILYHHPYLANGKAFKAEFDALPFPNDQALFQAWCAGQTGYPLVDAAMRQLNQTGYMHNRLRMVAASFLVKDLLIDWRWGERYFAEHLLDFDFSANNGGWQWAASTGCDAQPWFRIFNPVTQSQKFDPQGQFIRRYVPELAQLCDQDIHSPWQNASLFSKNTTSNALPNYASPIVDHAKQRRLALDLYQFSNKS